MTQSNMEGFCVKGQQFIANVQTKLQLSDFAVITVIPKKVRCEITVPVVNKVGEEKKSEEWSLKSIISRARSGWKFKKCAQHCLPVARAASVGAHIS